MTCKKVTRRFEGAHKSIALTGFLTVIIAYFFIFHNIAVSIIDILPALKAMAKLPVTYIRFMDDWIIFAKTRWHLRKAIKITNQILNQLNVLKHPDKTIIGRVERTFDFCGITYAAEGIVSVAKATKDKFSSKLSKLYEHPGRNKEKIRTYQISFESWIKGVVGKVVWANMKKPVGARGVPTGLRVGTG